MEQAIISGVAHDSGEGKLVIRGVPDKPGVAARIFTALADEHINIDMIVQNVSADGTTDISFTLPIPDGPGPADPRGCATRSAWPMTSSSTSRSARSHSSVRG
jgi:hypothetical protein